MPLILADQFLRNAELFRTTLFAGRTGSGKTLLAAIVAKMFKDTGIVRRVYSNIPISFGDNPPDCRFDFQAEYARNAAFLFDEAWLGLMSFDKNAIMRIFAFPRKNNQVFLLTSVLPLSSVSKYCFHNVTRSRNLQYFGIPLLSYRSEIVGSGDKPENFALFLPHLHYDIYDTTATPSDLYPIIQAKEAFNEAKREATAENQSKEKIGIQTDGDRKSTRLNSSHIPLSRMPSSA